MNRIVTILAWALVALTSEAPAGQQPATRPAQSVTQPGPAAVVLLHGEINDFSRRMLEQHFKQARQAGAKSIILHIDSYGGLVTSGLETSQFIKQQADLHVLAYVPSKAISAGAMIALACDEIVMGTAAVLGDCAPIAIGPTGMAPMGDAERAKAESPILADFADSAHRNGYDETLVSAMVKVGLSVYWVQNPADGERRFVSESEYKNLSGKVWGLSTKGWELVKEDGVANPVDAPDTLLTVNTFRAMKLGLAKASYATLEELTSSRNLRVVATFEPGWGEKLVGLLDRGWVHAILLIVFLMSLYAALHAPGHGFGEVIATISLALLVGVPVLTGHAQWWEILAIILGIVLLALELFVIPGFGVAGLAGIVLILGGLLMAFVAPEPGRSPFAIPRLPTTWAAIKQGLTVVVVGLACSLLLFAWLRRYLPKLPYFNRLILTTTVGGSESASVGSLTNIDPMDERPGIGAAGKALTDLRPGGSAEFTDAGGGRHIIGVVSDSGFVPHGASIVVREVAGSRVVVRPIDRA